MKYYEFGKENQQTFLLLPGTCCTVKSNFSQVILFLAKEFHVIGVDYDGFDDKGTEFTGMITVTQKIEKCTPDCTLNKLLHWAIKLKIRNRSDIK